MGCSLVWHNVFLTLAQGKITAKVKVVFPTFGTRRYHSTTHQVRSPRSRWPMVWNRAKTVESIKLNASNYVLRF